MPGPILGNEEKVENKMAWTQLSWRLNFIGEGVRQYKQVNEPCRSR